MAHGWSFVALPTPSGTDGSVEYHDPLPGCQGVRRGTNARRGAGHKVDGAGRYGRTSGAGYGTCPIGRCGLCPIPSSSEKGTRWTTSSNPDRIVIGTTHPEAAEVLASGVYGSGSDGGLPGPLVVTDPASAEMIKYAANAYLAARISFVNSIANLCEAVGADAIEVLAGMGRDHRIGPHYLETRSPDTVAPAYRRTRGRWWPSRSGAATTSL